MSSTRDVNTPIVIAIDGFSSCGKSTLAKQVAKELGYVFVDTGAMYRAVTLYFIDHHVDLSNEDEIERALSNIDIDFDHKDGQNLAILNGFNVEHEIRSLRVSQLVSEVAAISSVRRKLVDLQRKMAGQKGIVMDGRDIGTIVFPHADVKFFVTADPIVRAQRRYQELLSKKQKANLDEVISNLSHRDELDSNRIDSPLRRADDAILLDNTHFSVQEQFRFVIDIVRKKLQVV